MSNEQQDIIELVGQEYTKWFYDNAVPSISGNPILNGKGILTRGQFINKCKTDPEFSERWGLKIEERELSLEEKTDWLNKNYPLYGLGEWAVDKLSDKGYLKEVEVEYNIPTKLITITYNDKTIENYE